MTACEALELLVGHLRRLCGTCRQLPAVWGEALGREGMFKLPLSASEAVIQTSRVGGLRPLLAAPAPGTNLKFLEIVYKKIEEFVV